MYTNTHSFNKMCFIRTDSTPEIIYSTQASQTNIKISAFQLTPVRCAKAYFKYFFALSKAIESHSRYL
jgi:hypothetical protein